MIDLERTPALPPSRSTRLPTLLALLLIALSPAVAAAQKKVDPVNASRGVAIRGYDPVAYFEQGQATKGSQEHTFDWNGATWRFATAAHRDRFAADPERWSPQYGGYCAYAVSEGYTAGIDPEAFTVRDGKLYLNYSSKSQRTWLATVADRIRQADVNWPDLHR